MQFTGNPDTDGKILLSFDLTNVRIACQTSKYLSYVCSHNQDLVYKMTKAKRHVKNVLTIVQKRTTIHIDPYRVDERFNVFHDLIKQLGIKEEPLETDVGVFDNHPSNIQNNFYVVYIKLIKLVYPDAIGIRFETTSFDNPHELSGDATYFESTSHQCEEFLLHLFYNQTLLTF